MPYLVLLAFLWLSSPALTQGFRCAGNERIPTTEALLPPGIAAKPAQATPSRTTGTRRALLLFARFKGEPVNPVPPWAGDIFNPDLPGSFSHFYDTMSFGKLQVRGEVAPRVYEASQPASAYLENDQTPEEEFGRFSLEILRQADRDLDFAQFDNDGPDGVPDSGDDDGVVDAVFIVMGRVPTDFLLAEATGVGRLGFAEVFFSGDTGKKGKAIQVFPGQGTIQQGRSFAEAVGVVCHEYGHVLGLPDLYNTEFIAKERAGPEEDSAGVGAWCLMGWGATGWNGNDGPNSFCAWSRMKLGWAEVVAVHDEHQDIRLEEVGNQGKVVRVPLTGQEYYLVEYRRRTSTYYDRHLPGEGLLIWHVGTRRQENALASQVVVDLVCADGRWQDAGYPLGKVADPLQGEDNLDFWAHDEAYTRAHGGNWGDATDPFDGVRFTALTPETNPSSQSTDGRLSARIEGISVSGQIALFKTQINPLLLDIEGLELGREENDGVVVAGEEFTLKFTLVNQGGIPAERVRTVLHSDDSLIEILHPETPFRDLKPGQKSFGASAGGFPQARFREDFIGAHTAWLSLDFYANDQLLGTHEISVVGISPRQAVHHLAAVDTLGNRDGLVQPGEIFSLALDLGETPAALIDRCRFSLRSLRGLVQMGGREVRFERQNGRTVSRLTPEFLVAAQVEPGTQLDFEFEVRSEFSTWKDTLILEVQAGADRTAPRVLDLLARFGPEGLYLSLPNNRIIDGSALRAAQAVIMTASDTTQVATIPLQPREQGFGGMWPNPPPGNYLVRALVEDAIGNQGQSRLQPFTVLERLRSAPALFPGAWETLEIPTDQYRPVAASLYLSPSQPQVLYARADDGVWRSQDGGHSWDRTGMMPSVVSGGFLWQMLVDPLDPLKLYTGLEDNARSVDGGKTWESLPSAFPPIELLAVDPTRSGLLYGRQNGGLVVSSDGGESWHEVDLTLGVDAYPAFFRIHPADPQVLYGGELSTYSLARGFQPGTLGRSEDGGKSWATQRLEHRFYKVVPDPQSLDALYAISGDTIWYSDSRGREWAILKVLGGGWGKSGPVGLEAHPRVPGVLVAWTYFGARFAWKSSDRGQSWEEVSLPSSVSDLVLNPEDPDQFFLLNTAQRQLHSTSDNGRSWTSLSLPPVGAPAGVLTFDATGRLYAGSGSRDDTDRLSPRLYASSDGGRTWETVSEGNGYMFCQCMAQFEDLKIDPLNPQFMLGSFAWTFLRSTDGGETWRPSIFGGGVSTVSSYDHLVVDPTQTGGYFLVGSNRDLFWSGDWGGTWEKRTDGLPAAREDGEAGISSIAPDPSAPGVIYATIADSIWKSADQGKHWAYFTRMAEGHSIYQLAIHPQDTQRMYAATPQGLYLSQDRGRTWVLLVTTEANRGFRMRLRFDARDMQRFYWVTGPQLLETRDGGQTWRSLGDDLAGRPWFNDVAIDPLDPEVIYAATPWGVFRLDTRLVITAVVSEQTEPVLFALHPNYPNPINPTTTLRFSLPQAGEVELSIYNLMGQRVANLVRGVQEAGPHVLQWNGRDEQGRELASGVYFYHLQAGAQVETRKLLLLR